MNKSGQQRRERTQKIKHRRITFSSSNPSPNSFVCNSNCYNQVSPSWRFWWCFSSPCWTVSVRIILICIDDGVQWYTCCASRILCCRALLNMTELVSVFSSSLMVTRTAELDVNFVTLLHSSQRCNFGWIGCTLKKPINSNVSMILPKERAQCKSMDFFRQICIER